MKQISTEESIARILVTPLGSRVMMPEYGSKLFELIDKPVDDEWVVLASDYTFEAIETNEPRVIIKKVQIGTGNEVAINIEYTEDTIDKSINLDFVEVENVTT